MRTHWPCKAVRYAYWTGAAVYHSVITPMRTPLMKSITLFLAATLTGLATASCSTSPTSQIDQMSLPAADNTSPKRATPVVAGRPARMYIWAGFNEKDCRVLTPKITLAQKPTKGEVSFRPNQMTTIRHSNSGKCIGKRLPGTGIYYTARKEQKGADHFSVIATTSSAHAVTRSFQVQIVE